MGFNEVYFSEMGEAEATHSRDPRKINLGEQGKTLGVLGRSPTLRTVKFLLYPFTLRSGVKLRPQSQNSAF